MATGTAELVVQTTARALYRGVTVCHFTTAHTELKSRSFHRELMPLAECGLNVRYVAQMDHAERRGGIDFVALPVRTSRLRRVLAAPALLRTLLRVGADLYHFQDPELLPIAFALKLLFRKRVVYDAYEDFPSMVLNKRFVPWMLRRAAARVIDWTEQQAARCFDGVITADSLTLRRLARYGKSRKLVFYNFPNLDFFPAPKPHPKRFDVVYRGGLSGRAGIYVLLEAMRLLAARGRPTHLLLIGYFDDTATERELRDRIRASGLASRIVIRGRLDHERMADALSEARIGVSPLQPIPKFLRNIPVKIFEYWACGLPVVASALPPILPFFRHAEAGLLYSPTSSEQLADAVGWLLDDPDAAALMGQRGRELVTQRFNNRSEVHKLRRFCARIAAREGGGSVEGRRQGDDFLCSNRS
jgi:glycosyltransferase involved in cell wall biosynthesis